MTFIQKTIADFKKHQDTITRMLDLLSQLGWDVTYYNPNEYYARRGYDVDGDSYIEWGTIQGGDEVGLAYFTPADGSFFHIDFSLTDVNENVAKIIQTEQNYRMNSLITNLEDAYQRNLYVHKERSELLEWVKQSFE